MKFSNSILAIGLGTILPALRVLNGLICNPSSDGWFRGAAAAVAWVDHNTYLFGGCFVFVPSCHIATLPGQLATSLRPKLASPLSSQESCQATRSDPKPTATEQQMFYSYSRVKERVSKHDLWLDCLALESVLESYRNGKRRSIFATKEMANATSLFPLTSCQGGVLGFHRAFASKDIENSTEEPVPKTKIPILYYTIRCDRIFPALCRFYGVLWFRITISRHKRHTAAYFWAVNCLHSIKTRGPINSPAMAAH